MPVSDAILIVMGLLTVAMLSAGLCRNLPVPYTVFLVLIGMGLGAVARTVPHADVLLNFQLTPEVVLFLFLPALLFESAFNLNARQLLKDLGPVLTLAIPALLISTAIIGIGIRVLLGIDLILALLFGALISATDPVAVIALFKELGAPERLTILVEGESLLNDATAIVVFNILLALAISGAFSASDAGFALVEFLRVFFGGILVGAAIGLAISELFHRFFAGVAAFVVMSVVVAYASFVLAEHTLHVSGVMAVVAAAIALGALWVSRISQADTHVVKETWEVIALVSNSLLFLLVGLSVNVVSLIERIDVIAIAVLAVLLARAVTIYTLVPVTIRFFSLPHVTVGERHIMWWGGLKGGLAIAIVLSIPEDLPGRDLLLDLTLGVVMFSLLVNAPTIRPLIKRFGIDKLTADEQSELRAGLTHAGHRSSSVLDLFRETGLVSRKTEQLIRKNTRQVFSGDAPVLDKAQSTRHLHIIALKAESDELKHLHEIGLIQHYSYLDIKNNIQRDRERILSNQAPGDSTDIRTTPGVISKIENALLKRVREHDWAVPLLSRYQHSRFSQRLKRDMAGVLVCTAVLEMLGNHTELDEDQREQVAARYKERLRRRRLRISMIAEDFPEFYSRFETRVMSEVVLNAAGHHIEAEHREGEIGAKVAARIQGSIRRAVADLPPITVAAPVFEAGDLIGSVPLLAGLSGKVLGELVECSNTITFLPGDVVIGEGQRGDALYLIKQGKVAVFKGDQIVTELSEGDFFGEMALLGDQVRQATVKATKPSTLLRLKRNDVMQLADKEPELKSKLVEIMDQRAAQTALVGKIPFLKDLSPDILAVVADQTRTLCFGPGASVVLEGERGDSLYIILDGVVDVYRSGANIAELGAGEFFGEMGLLGDSIRTATVRARERATLARLRRSDVMRLSEIHEELRSRLQDAKKSRQQMNIGKSVSDEIGT